MAWTHGQARSAGGPDVANWRGGTDQLRAPDTAANRPRPWSSEDLRQRLERLPPGHPSSPYNADGSRKPPPPSLRSLELPEPAEAPAGDAPTSVEPLTDAEHSKHVAELRDLLAEAHDSGLATELRFFSREEDSWTIERQIVHRDLVDEMYALAADVPCEQKAVMAGGLAGSGKTTVLSGHADIDRSQYLTINPDDVKREIAAHGLIPETGGLSPMEASDLVHEESSHIAKMLAERALRDGKNIIWDITMASKQSTERRLDDLDRAGYATSGIFVDISTEVSVRRADGRHRDGHEQYRNGHGMGGRFVPQEVITAKADAEWGSANRRTFEGIKNRFADWAVYDNSVDGRSPVMVASGDKARGRENEW